MNYIGKRVLHKTMFGEGVIVAQDQNNYITVRFDFLPGTKKFAAPVCFTSFLQLLDADAAKHATEEAQAHEAQTAAEKAKRELDQRIKVFERQAQIKQAKEIQRKE